MHDGLQLQSNRGIPCLKLQLFSSTAVKLVCGFATVADRYLQIGVCSTVGTCELTRTAPILQALPARFSQRHFLATIIALAGTPADSFTIIDVVSDRSIFSPSFSLSTLSSLLSPSVFFSPVLFSPVLLCLLLLCGAFQSRLPPHPLTALPRLRRWTEQSYYNSTQQNVRVHVGMVDSATSTVPSGDPPA